MRKCRKPKQEPTARKVLGPLLLPLDGIKPHIRWILTYSDSLRAILDNSKDNAWTIDELLEWSTQPAEKCNCREIALLNPDILDPYTQHVRTASLSKVLYAASNSTDMRPSCHWLRPLSNLRSWVFRASCQSSYGSTK